MTPTKVLITGAGGFLGGATARACRKLWPDATMKGIDLHAGPPDVDSTCDLTQTGEVIAIMGEFVPDVVFHMAGTTRNADWPALWATNVLSLANMLDVATQYNAKCRFLVPGSAAEYGDWGPDEDYLDESHELRPSSPYGVSKAWQSLLAQHYAARGAHVIIARLFNLSGKGVPPQFVLGAVANQLRRILAGESEPVVRLGDASPVRDFIDIEDACAALLALALEGRPGEIYNVCSGEPCTVADAVRELVRLSATGAQILSDEPAPDRAGISWSVGSNAKLLAETSWRPRVSLAESLRRMLA